MIPAPDQERIRQRFRQDLTSRLRLDLFWQRPSPLTLPGQQPCEFCEDAHMLVQELAVLSDRIALTVHELRDAPAEAAELGVDKVPALVIRGKTNRPLRFFGMPTGTQFVPFIETLIEASKGAGSLLPETQRLLRRIRSEVRLQVFVVPSCLNSPDVAFAAFRFALHNVKIKVDVIEATEFPSLVQRYDVRATPTIVINDRPILAGAMPEAQLAELVAGVVENKPLPAALAGIPATPLAAATQTQERRESYTTTSSGLIIPG